MWAGRWGSRESRSRGILAVRVSDGRNGYQSATIFLKNTTWRSVKSDGPDLDGSYGSAQRTGEAERARLRPVQIRDN